MAKNAVENWSKAAFLFGENWNQLNSQINYLISLKSCIFQCVFLQNIGRQAFHFKSALIQDEMNTHHIPFTASDIFTTLWSHYHHLQNFSSCETKMPQPDTSHSPPRPLPRHWCPLWPVSCRLQGPHWSETLPCLPVRQWVIWKSWLSVWNSRQGSLKQYGPCFWPRGSRILFLKKYFYWNMADLQFCSVVLVPGI